jgi:hypothetical protein
MSNERSSASVGGGACEEVPTDGKPAKEEENVVFVYK